LLLTNTIRCVQDKTRRNSTAGGPDFVSPLSKGHIMRASIGRSTFSRISGAVAGLWLCGAGAAWAGDGASVGSLQSIVFDPLCQFLGVTSCPQFPTVNQLVAEISALQNTPPNVVRYQLIGLYAGLDQSSGACSVAGNSFGGFAFVPCDALAINAVNPGLSGNVSQKSLSGLAPLAFAPVQGVNTPVPAGTSGISSLFYAVASGANEQPDSLNLYYDYPGLTSPNFTKGQVIAEISLPLQVVNADGSERLICGPQAPGSSTASCAVSLATLQVTAVSGGGANSLSAVVIGDFTKQGTIDTQSPTAGSLGVHFQFIFAPSPSFSSPHAIFNVQVPLIATGPTDPAYFGVTPFGATNGIAAGTPTYINQASGLPTAFTTNTSGVKIGVTPSAAPETVGDGTKATFGYCASFLATGAASIHPAVAAFLSIGTDGTAYASSPIPPFTGIQLQCPF
jgi:hypothetical protein